MGFSRRNFLKLSGMALATMPFANQLIQAPAANAADAKLELPLAKEGEGTAKALKYCANADKPNKHCEPRKAKDKSSQYCYNCQLYTGAREKKGTGKCLIMPKNTVEAAGWCQSWVQAPGVKS